MAVIVPDVWEQPPDVDAMRSASRATLAGYKVPTVWKFVTELPRNAAGKPLRCKSRTCRTDSFAAVIESSPDAFKSGAARVRVAVEERRTSEPFVDSIDLALDAAERVDDSMRPGTVAIGQGWTTRTSTTSPADERWTRCRACR